MNSGSFFRLDIESSKVSEGITFYEYIDLPDLVAGKENIRYPIRMSISQDRVCFFVHYFDDSGNYLLRHTEEVILDLPFSTTNPEALSSIIKRIYNTVFPISDYLLKVMERRYDCEKEEELRNKIDLNKVEYTELEKELRLKRRYDSKKEEELRNKVKLYEKENADLKNEIGIIEKYKPLKKSQINKDSYSSLFIWGLIDNLDSDFSSYQLQNSEKKFSRFLRKLLLDFMFDLMHSDVFESSKSYPQMREGLMNDFFFSSIVKKSEFYYCRSLIRSRHKEAHTNEKSIFSFIKELYAVKLDDAESTWLDAIMSPLADKHFPFSPEWFEEPVKGKKKKGRFSVSESWFVDPEEEMQRVVFPLNDENNTIHYLNSHELCNLIGTKDNSSVLARQTKISKWFYSRFDFVDTFRIHIFKHWNHLFFASLLLFGIVAIIPCIGFWESPQYIALFPAAMSAVFLLVFIGCSLYFCYKNLRGKKPGRIDDILSRNRLKRERWESLHFSVFFAAIWAFLPNDYMTNNWAVVLSKCLILLGIVVVVWYIIKSREHLIDNVHLFMPRLVASITTAWIMLVIGNDLVKERLTWPLWVVLSFVVFVFILYETNKGLHNLSTGDRILRAVELMLISYSISLVVGIFAIDVLSPSFIADVTEAVNCKHYAIEKPVVFSWTFMTGGHALTTTIIPKYLIQFSFLAMFIGVFIQMIFEEKNITEM